MPQSGVGAISSAGAGAAKKKKKGRPPAHQNVFAFRHNPKSTKTAAILATPIRHCCRRCHDKLVWRKNYRKYKPLTQASTCNICRQRNITAAYHTICTKCTQSSSTAVALLQTWNDERNGAALIVDAADEEEFDSSDDDDDSDNGVDDDDDAAADDENAIFDDDDNRVDTGKEPANETANETANATEAVDHYTVHSYMRVCAMCVKQPALPDEEDEASTDWDNTVVNPDGTRRPLKLRELKSMRRQREKTLVKKPKKAATDDNDENNDHDDKNENDNDDSEEKGDLDDEGSDEPERHSGMTDTADDDDDDPFLKAVGGANNLLTGEAFQQMLLKTGKLNLNPVLQLSQQSDER